MPIPPIFVKLGKHLLNSTVQLPASINHLTTLSEFPYLIMENSLQSFPYKSLAKGTSEIRLMILEPGDFEEPVRSHLQLVKLDHRPDYEALSYVWGSCNDRKSISLNGMEFAVTANLFIALRYLRRQDKPRTVWVDAVCINQADASERGGQVARMGDIYRQATKVVIWVGEDIMDPTWNGVLCVRAKYSHTCTIYFRSTIRKIARRKSLSSIRATGHAAWQPLLEGLGSVVCGSSKSRSPTWTLKSYAVAHQCLGCYSSSGLRNRSRLCV